MGSFAKSLTAPPTPWVVYATATVGMGEGSATIPGNVFHPLEGSPLTLRFIVPFSGKVEIRIYNRQGFLVKSIEKEAAPGAGSVTWDGHSDGGPLAASGVYGVHFRAKGLNKILKIVVIK